MTSKAPATDGSSTNGGDFEEEAHQDESNEKETNTQERTTGGVEHTNGADEKENDDDGDVTMNDPKQTENNSSEENLEKSRNDNDDDKNKDDGAKDDKISQQATSTQKHQPLPPPPPLPTTTTTTTTTTTDTGPSFASVPPAAAAAMGASLPSLMPNVFHAFPTTPYGGGIFPTLAPAGAGTATKGKKKGTLSQKRTSSASASASAAATTTTCYSNSSPNSTTLSELTDVLRRSLELLEEVHDTVTMTATNNNNKNTNKKKNSKASNSRSNRNSIGQQQLKKQQEENKRKLRLSIDTIRHMMTEEKGLLPSTKPNTTNATPTTNNSKKRTRSTPGDDDDDREKKQPPSSNKKARGNAGGSSSSTGGGRVEGSSPSSIPEPVNGLIYTPLEAHRILKNKEIAKNPGERIAIVEKWMKQKKILQEDDGNDTAKQITGKLVRRMESDLIGKWWRGSDSYLKSSSSSSLIMDAGSVGLKSHGGGGQRKKKNQQLGDGEIPLPENGLIYSPHEAWAILRDMDTRTQRSQTIDLFITNQEVLVRSKKQMENLVQTSDPVKINPWWNGKEKPHFLQRGDLIKVVETQLTVQQHQKQLQQQQRGTTNNGAAPSVPDLDQEDLRSVLRMFKDYGIQCAGFTPSSTVTVSDKTVDMFLQLLKIIPLQQKRFNNTTGMSAGAGSNFPLPENGFVYTPREVHKYLSDRSLDNSIRNKIIDDWIKDGRIPFKGRDKVLTILSKRPDQVKDKWTQRCHISRKDFLGYALPRLGTTSSSSQLTTTTTKETKDRKEEVRRILLEMMGYGTSDAILSVNDINSRAVTKYMLMLDEDPTINDGDEDDHDDNEDEDDNGNDDTVANKSDDHQETKKTKSNEKKDQQQQPTRGDQSDG